MGTVVNISNSNDLNSKAIEWVVKFDGHRLSPEEFAQFKEWYDYSSDHAEAFRKAAGMWGNLDILSEFPLLKSAQEPLPIWRRFTQGLSITILRPQISFAVAILLLAVVSLTYYYKTPDAPRPQIYTTAIGNNQTISLSDGSTVILNTGSQIEVLFSEHRRSLKLLKGEAHFDVAHDKSRPFEVHAGTNIVRAVGTAFTVELKPELVEVTVTEGKVQLATLGEKSTPDGDQNETPLALVRSGQSAEFTTEIKTITSIDADEINRRLAWRKGALIFNGEALEDVIDEVSRYTKTRIIISDPEIRHLKIGGYYKTSETDALLRALEASFGIAVKRVNQDLVYLSRSVDS